LPTLDCGQPAPRARAVISSRSIGAAISGATKKATTSANSPPKPTEISRAPGAAVAAVVIALIAVGHGPAGHGRADHPGPVTSRPVPGATRIGTEALDFYFPASGATYTQGLAFGWLEQKITARDVGPCLPTAGFPQPPFRTSRPQYQLAFFSEQFIDLAQLAAHPGQHVYTGNPLVRHPTAARQRRFDRAQRRCTAEFAGAVTRADQAAAGLSGAWTSVFSRIQDSRRVTALRPAFARCLQHHGVPARYARQVDPASSPVFAGYNAWGDTLIQSAPSAARLAADQRHEDRVLVACARPAVTVMERLQLARRAVFFRAHAAQIARIRQLAQRIARPAAPAS